MAKLTCSSSLWGRCSRSELLGWATRGAVQVDGKSYSTVHPGPLTCTTAEHPSPAYSSSLAPRVAALSGWGVVVGRSSTSSRRRVSPPSLSSCNGADDPRGAGLRPPRPDNDATRPSSFSISAFCSRISLWTCAFLSASPNDSRVPPTAAAETLPCMRLPPRLVVVGEREARRREDGVAVVLGRVVELLPAVPSRPARHLLFFRVSASSELSS